MSWLKKIPFFLTALWPICVSAHIVLQQRQQRQDFEDNPYWHREILDPHGKYQLEWLVDWSRERVQFNVTVVTRGYVALGLSRDGKMEGADIVIGGVASNGKPYFSDRHGVGNQETVQDLSQDWVLLSAQESKTETFLSFSRPFDTCDEHDIPIGDDAIYVLWAYGERDDDVTNSQLGNWGSYVTYLRDPDVAPRSILESNQNVTFGGGKNRKLVPERVGDARRWAIRKQFQIPPQKTTYWCNVYKFSPPTPGKKHMIGYNVRINPESLQNMHHMLMYRCNLPPGVNPAIVYDPLIGGNGQECYSLAHLNGPIPTQFCTDLKIGFAIGGRPTFFPNNVGIAIGDHYSEEYYVLQVHYDNPDLRSDIQSDIQLDVYYTSNLRENDGGVLSLGQHIPGAPSILIPPGQLDHKIYGHCSSSCTRKMLPPGGIKLSGALLHTHVAGRRVRLQHFRNGKELPWILNDDNYQFQFQPNRILRNEVTVLPGDQVSVQCYYDTTMANMTTVGGYATEQEMCKTFLLYHTVLDDYGLCRSEIMSQEYMMRYLAGTSNVTWNESRLEYVANSPQHLAGQTLSSISDSQHVNWTVDLLAQLRRDHIVHPQQTVCPSLQEAMSGNVPAPDFVSFPVEAVEYVPPQRCSLQSPLSNTLSV